MRELTEKELALVSGGMDTSDIDFGWGSSGGITGPTVSGGDWSISVGGGSGAGPDAGVGTVGGVGVSVSL